MDKPNNIYPTLESIRLRQQEIQNEIRKLQRDMASCVTSLITPSASSASLSATWIDRWLTRITLSLRIAKGLMTVIRAFRK